MSNLKNNIFIYTLIITPCCLYIISCKEVILSSGLGGWTHQQLWNQYTTFKAYSDMNIITSSSMLVYYLTENGTLGIYSTNDPDWSAEQYQVSIKKDFNLKALPCLYCDATIGLCSDLSGRLENMYNHQNYFINETILKAKKYGWDGFTVDFEPDSTVDSTKLTDFIIKWSDALHNNNLILSVWIGGPTQYEMNRLFNVSNLFLVTMDTYIDSFFDFVNVAAPLQTSINNISRLGFGLLTNYDKTFGKSFGKIMPSNNDDYIKSIIKWIISTKTQPLSLWASHIPPFWYEALNLYVKSS